MQFRSSSVRRDDGFSLIEVLVALTVLALVLGTAWRLLGDGLNGIRQAEARAAAVAIAEAQLTALAASGISEAGRFDGQDDGYRWTLSISRRLDPPFSAVESLGLRAWRVSVVVTDPRGITTTLSQTQLTGSGQAAAVTR